MFRNLDTTRPNRQSSAYMHIHIAMHSALYPAHWVSLNTVYTLSRQDSTLLLILDKDAGIVEFQGVAMAAVGSSSLPELSPAWHC